MSAPRAEVNCPAERSTLWTVGHSTLDIDALLANLKRNAIEVIADVRRFAGSRRYPQFGASALARSLGAADLAYAPLPELGGRRTPRPDSHNTVWRNASFRGYADYMETQAFDDAAARLATIARERATAIMCAEAVWWRCHRALIADAFSVSGWRVLHIDDGGRVSPHPLTAAARNAGGRLSYRDDAETLRLF
jgi:uncharacterized protein (DUF488 family)